ncbi:antibiotic synthetase, putative [Perkinsus marinus ATCC 50983]|uniref:Antibiotic synthetase, putative n=1 Tax=Perkinsus marinus (strain ATCC 50983 / TXsc) TaxID=423536 RepID=C5KW28_PERM5|nr:antibiotic synthetase, putative [Perkinsus marinus ATCC 50983]EER11315.1 antibiotic synthetase, putative [Perkinsus marinus ATCC 50983]|eukprot:XP_002779520.1 antibiotic synthetase, putative [Perkinsus marinus ATCC 50983]
MEHLPYDNLWLDFVAAAVEFPDNIALRCNTTVFTYQQLRRVVEVRAAVLSRQYGLVSGSRVLLLLQRGVSFVVTALALWNLDCTMIPLDADLTPDSRAQQVAEEGDCDLLIVTTGRGTIDLSSVNGRVVGIDELDRLEDSEAIEKECDERSAPAYIMFTSGSSGRPKGVVVSHTSVVNVLEHFAAELGPDWHRLLAVTTFQFDISVLEYMLPLTTGRQCIIANTETCRSAPKILDMLIEDSIDLMHATPTMWQLLVAAGLLKRVMGLTVDCRSSVGASPSQPI